MSVAVVTGAAGGIGREVVRALVAQGHSVVATDRDASTLRAAAEAERWPHRAVTLRPLDVRDPGAWEALVDEVESDAGPVDLLFLVAGVLRPGWVVETAAEDYDLHFDVNVAGVVHGARVVGRRMRDRGRGHLILVASLAGVAGIPGIALYSASKFAVRGFGLALAQELRPHGVRVSVVCPDAVETPMLTVQEDRPEAALTFSGPRALTAREVAEVLTGRVLRDAPVEVLLPGSRGWLAKVGSAFPALAGRLEKRLRAVGEKRQRGRVRRGGESG